MARDSGSTKSALPDDARGAAIEYGVREAEREFNAHVRRKDRKNKGRLVTFLHTTKDMLSIFVANGFEAGAKWERERKK